MKVTKILSIVLAMIMLVFCFASCNEEEPETPGNAAGPKMNIKVGVYTLYDVEEKKDTEKSPIIGATAGMDISYKEGENVTVIEVVTALAAERKATFVPTNSGGVDLITFERLTYQTSRQLNTQKKYTVDGKEVYYYDMFMWKYFINGTAADMDTPLKDGDSIELHFIREALNEKNDEYVTVEDYEASKNS